jgi:tetratricopeptide (TPR) repeat protein
VLGDYLARRFPDHPNARQAAAIALAAYQKLRQDEAARAQAAETAAQTPPEVGSTADAVAASSAKVAQLADYVVARWPDTDEAAGAIAVLAALAVERQDIDAALALVGKLKPDTARRADTELRIGRAIWAQYVRAKKEFDEQAAQAPTAQGGSAPGGTGKQQLVSGGSSVADRKTLAQWAAQAQALLEKGLSTAKKADAIDRQFVVGQWALVQSYVNTSQPQKAIAWLEDDTIGLLKLVGDKHEAAEIEGLMFDVYRLALRAYIAAKPQQLDKALATMDALEKITGSDAKGREMLTAVYIAMGRDLQREIRELVAAGDTTQVAELSTAFEAFLKRLVGRESGNNFNSLFWVADTYVELGAGLAQAPLNSAAADADRKRGQEYYAQAVAAFEAILNRDQADGQFMPDKYLPLVEMKLAKAYRGAGEYEKALALLTRLLKDKPAVLDVQFDAAYTYQELAASDPAKHSRYFRRAILGGDTDESRHIWGWNALAQKIRAQQTRLRVEAGDPAKAEQAEDYRQRYQEARYNSVYCTFTLATHTENQAERNRLLKVARQGIWSVYAIVDPELGGGSWKAKNERLLRDIQRALGEPEIGLKELEQKKKSQTTATK